MFLGSFQAILDPRIREDDEEEHEDDDGVVINLSTIAQGKLQNLLYVSANNTTLAYESFC